MEIKNVKQLIAYKNGYFRKLSERQIRLEKTTDKEEKRKLKKDIKIINEKLDEIQALLEKTTNFNVKEFANFMKDVLCFSGRRLNVYKHAIHALPDEAQTLRKVFQCDKCNIYLLCDQNTYDYIDEHIYYINEYERFLNTDIADSITIFERKKVYPFDEYLSVSNEFSRYPRMKNAIYELIQLKLDNPNITDKERYEKVLSNIYSRVQNKSYEKLNYIYKRKPNI